MSWILNKATELLGFFGRYSEHSYAQASHSLLPMRRFLIGVPVASAQMSRNNESNCEIGANDEQTPMDEQGCQLDSMQAQKGSVRAPQQFQGLPIRSNYVQNSPPSSLMVPEQMVSEPMASQPNQINSNQAQPNLFDFNLAVSVLPSQSQVSQFNYNTLINLARNVHQGLPIVQIQPQISPQQILNQNQQQIQLQVRKIEQIKENETQTKSCNLIEKPNNEKCQNDRLQREPISSLNEPLSCNSSSDEGQQPIKIVSNYPEQALMAQRDCRYGPSVSTISNEVRRQRDEEQEAFKRNEKNKLKENHNKSNIESLMPSIPLSVRTQPKYRIQAISQIETGAKIDITNDQTAQNEDLVDALRKLTIVSSVCRSKQTKLQSAVDRLAPRFVNKAPVPTVEETNEAIEMELTTLLTRYEREIRQPSIMYPEFTMGPISIHEFDRITQIMEGRARVNLVFNFPPQKIINLTEADFKTLAKTSWLNDAVIECYLEMVIRSLSNEQAASLQNILTKTPSVKISNFRLINSLFTSSTLLQKNPSQIERIFARRSIAAADSLVFLINRSKHWFFVTAQMGVITVYDSIRRDQSYYQNEVPQIGRLRTFLQSFHSSYEVKVHISMSFPQQQNYYDCGIMAIAGVCEVIRKGGDDDCWMFEQPGMPYKRLAVAIGLLRFGTKQ